MSAKMNKMTLLSVGVAGLGLLACGPSNKDGQPKPVDSITVRQAIVGNTKGLAADFSRTAQFLEASTLLQNGVGLARTGAGACVATPDDAGGCDTVEEPATTEIDLDINAATSDITAELERRVLADANIESQSEFAVTYLISGAVACAEEGQPLDAECVDSVDHAEIRLVVTSPAEGDVDVDVLVGPQRANPLSFEFHRDQLAAEVDLGGVKAAADHVATRGNDTFELPATFEGRVRAEIGAPNDHQIAAALSVLQAVKVADGEFSLSIAPSSPALSVALDSTAKTVLSTTNLGTVAGNFPITSYSYDSTTNVDTESSYDLGFLLAGSTGSALLDVASEVLTLTGIGLGSSTSSVSIDGNQVVAIDLNAADGRAFNASVRADGDDAVRIEVDPKFDLSVALQFAAAVNALGEVDDWMLDEVLRVTLGGAAKPAIRIDGEQLEVLDGTLTLALENAAITHTIAAGQCLLSDIDDAPQVDPEVGSDPDPILEDASSPLDHVLVGACL